MSDDEKLLEVMKCSESAAYFIDKYCQIYDALDGGWIPFKLWPDQVRTLEAFEEHNQVVVLKARQLGLTWLCLGYALWKMIFRPIATILLFSKRDDEATYLLSDERMKGMYRRLPRFLQLRHQIVKSSHVWRFGNGSTAKAFPTTAGDSYTASVVIIDEADLVPDFNKLMRSVKPTVDAGGKLLLVSRVDKTTPESEFKRTYRDAVAKKNDWFPIFIPWYARPSRTPEWYERQRRDSISRTGSLDDIYEQYPATPEEALAPRSLDKRISPTWLLNCFEELEPLEVHEMYSLPHIRVFKAPEVGKEYIGGMDPAEGNPTSDDSVVTIIDKDTGEEVCNLGGKLEPQVISAYASKICEWYNHAELMVERNNHGHACILWLVDNSPIDLMLGFDNKQGWMSSSKGKSLMYDSVADALRTQTGTIHSRKTYEQLSSIEGSSLRAPDRMPDDYASAYALAMAAREYSAPGVLFA